MSYRYDVIIVGGGPAGMMAAIKCAEHGMKTLIIEKNRRYGMKLGITGKGRCNVTNACDREQFFDNIIHGKKFLMSAYSKFTSWDTMGFFEDIGVPLKIERGRRVFPNSDRARDVVMAMYNRMEKVYVQMDETKCRELAIEKKKLVGVVTNECVIEGDNVIIATGGLSYPSTGSSGDGYRFAKQAGHTITDLQPCLSAVVVKEENVCLDLMGLSLKNVELKLFKGEECVYRELGEMIFTHFGVSGPLVLTASAYMDHPEKGGYHFEIDLKPALDLEQLDARMLREFNKSSNRIIYNVLRSLVPVKMIKTVLETAKIDGKTVANSITKEERLRLEKTLKGIRLHIKAFRSMDEAIITSGGVELTEITPKTMESKKMKNLYFIGEVLDAHGLTGGYNLQIAFSTAVAAANSVIKKYDERKANDEEN